LIDWFIYLFIYLFIMKIEREVQSKYNSKMEWDKKHIKIDHLHHKTFK